MLRDPAAPALSDLTIKIASSLKAVDAAVWDACANPAPLESKSEQADSVCEPNEYNPFVSHAFLSSLEDSRSAVARTGWKPAHVLVEDHAGALIAACPAYLKSHSQGEYVFDHGWADAFANAGGEYYPKLQVSVPFTPATGRRLLVKPGATAPVARDALVAGLRAAREQLGASSIHVTFLTKGEWDDLGAHNFLLRTHQQFHWTNAGYRTFDEFLAALASRKRKAINRERRDAVANGITIERLTGADLTERVWDDFFRFYMDTGGRKWGRPYLTREFYSLVGVRMAKDIVLVMAKRAGRYIAGAINFVGSDALYGRHWGCIEHHPFLHFEVCYYQAIDEAIARGLRRVEAGAQGEHKLARGYLPVETYSAHDIAHPGLRRAVADYLARERRHVSAAIEEYGEYAPFRRDGGATAQPVDED
ncbi:GNAT family N-acetyltransferase [Terrarubrum flagellatum]|uniref:GNAT family N-acetyltransferase n=1 Tax=Terrirubrum flagellatum TaxID=2895980 RepID=UPI00314541FE